MSSTLQPHEIDREIADRLSQKAHEWWCGACRQYRDEIVSIGQRDGIEAAVAEVEELAMPAT